MSDAQQLEKHVVETMRLRTSMDIIAASAVTAKKMVRAGIYDNAIDELHRLQRQTATTIQEIENIMEAKR